MVRIAEPAWHSFGGVFDTPSSECFNGQRKHVANTAFGQDDARRVWIGLQLAPQAQYLNVDTAIQDIFVGSKRAPATPVIGPSGASRPMRPSTVPSFGATS